MALQPGYAIVSVVLVAVKAIALVAGQEMNQYDGAIQGFAEA